MKHAVLAFLLVIAAFSSARAEMFDVVNIPDRENISFQFSYKGINLKNPPKKPFALHFQAAEAAVKADYITRMVGDGPARHVEVEIKALCQNGYTTQEIFRFKPGQKLVLAYSEKNVFLSSGRKIRTESYDLSESNPPLPKEMTHPHTLPLALRGMEFKPGLERSFYIWFNPTLVFAVKMAVKGQEEITVPAGTFRCNRLEIAPDLTDFSGPIVGQLLKPLIAPYIVWMDAKSPYKIVRYQGPFGMVNIKGPTEIYELAKVGDQ